MVRPVDFGWNEQTAADNEFQHRPEASAESVRALALAEFDNAVQTLRTAGVTVLVLEPEPAAGTATRVATPDAVFPNNWFSVWPDGRVFLYPMRTANRRAEVRPMDLLTLLNQACKTVRLHAVGADADGPALEGTGSLVFDHKAHLVYGALSERCDAELARAHARDLGYEPVLFDTRSSTGKPFYHSNVMLSVGEDFALICLEAIADRAQRAQVLAHLHAHQREVVELTLAQTETAFCANVLQLATHGGGRIIALSQTAHDGLTAEQRGRLAAQGKLVTAAIPTIERIGGGSLRCMIAEVF